MSKLDDILKKIEANGKPPKMTLDQEYEVMMKISEQISSLAKVEPFYASFFSQFDRCIDYTIPTAAVGPRGGKIVYMFNPYFMMALSELEACDVVNHESLHLLQEHLVRAILEGDEKMNDLKNIAMDCSINQFLKHLPEGCVTLESVSKQVGQQLKPHLAWEEYYEIIKKAESKKQQQGGKGQGNQQGQGGNGGQGQGQQGQRDLSGYGKVLDQHDKMKPEEGQGQGEGKDGKEAGKAGDTANPDFNTEYFEAMVKAAAKEALETAQSFGKMPDPNVVEMVRKLTAVKPIRWDKVLESFLSTTRSAERQPTMFKEMKKQEGQFPGKRRHFLPEVLAYSDTSGSVSDDMFYKALTRMDEICKKVGVTPTLSFFDADISKVIKAYRPGTKIGRTHGGTDFQPCVDDAVKRKKKHIVIFTDGIAPPPNPRGVKILWCILGTALEDKWVQALPGCKIQVD